MSLQKLALDELKIYATFSKPHEVFDTLRQKAALNLAECYLLAFGTDYDSKEALHWLQAARSYGASSISLGRLSEALAPSSSVVISELRSQHQTIQIPRLEDATASELWLSEKLQSRAVSAANQIRDPSSKGMSEVPLQYIGMHAPVILSQKIGTDIVGFASMTHLDIAALLGNDKVIPSLFSDDEAISDRKTRINALHFACIGGNLSSLRILLESGANHTACGEHDITPLHLMIYMPVELVQEAVSLLVAHGASTQARSKVTRLGKTTIVLDGTPIEWAVIARHRSLVAALLPHSKGQERSVLRMAISYAYYEIAEDLLSNDTLSGLFSEADCPILNYSRVFTHLFAHGRDGDIAIDRTIRLCHKYGLIDYSGMLSDCICLARSRSCLKALEVLLELCPPSIIRQGFDSDTQDELLTSHLYTAMEQARNNTAWKPVLEAILRNFSADELGKTRRFKGVGKGESVRTTCVLLTAVAFGWTIGAQVLLDKGVDRYVTVKDRYKNSIFDVAARVGNVEMEAFMARYKKENEDLVEGRIAQVYPSWWDPLSKDIARENFNAFGGKSLENDVQSPATIVVAKAHKALILLLTTRDIYFTNGPSHEHWRVFDTSPMDGFRALIFNEAMAGNIDVPDELNVTMLQRAAAYLDLDIVRLLLEAGADANVPFLANKKASDDRTDVTTVPFLPFQIAICMSPWAFSFAKGNISTTEMYNPISHERTNLEPTTATSQFRHRVAQAVSTTVKASMKRIKASTNSRALTGGEQVAESMRNTILRVAQEFLKWHLLRNDPRFEGITEYHICPQMVYKSHVLKLVRRNFKICDVKASWPGLDGKFTGEEMVNRSWSKDHDWNSFFVPNFRRLRGRS